MSAIRKKITEAQKKYGNNIFQVDNAGVKTSYTPTLNPQRSATSTTTLETPNTNAFQKYKEQLELSKANAKVDIANANTKANQYLNNYLRMQGIQNSGLGASAVGQVNANTVNAMANQDLEYNKAIADYQEQYNQKMVDRAGVLLGGNRTTAQNYINQIQGQEGVNQDTIDYLKGYSTQNYATLDDDVQTGLTSLAEIIQTNKENGTWSNDEFNNAVDAYGELENVKSEEQLKAWNDKYGSLLNTTSSGTNISKNMLSTSEKAELEEAGITDFTPIDIDMTNKDSIKKWLTDNFDFYNAKNNQNIDKQVNDIYNAKDGKTVTINQKGKNTKLYVKNGKVYVKEMGKKKND